jgi:hypothetical protein
MRIAKDDVPVQLQAPGAVARVQAGFGSARAYADLSAEYFSLAAGTDLAPLFTGLQDDLCQSPHWGYMASGSLTVTYGDGTTEQVHGGDLFYWPPSHSVRVHEDAELLMFSPVHEHLQVLDHVKAKLGQ